MADRFICEPVGSAPARSGRNYSFTCKDCGSPFERAWKTAVYCSDACARSGRSKTAKSLGIRPPQRWGSRDKAPRQCAQCGASFVPYRLSGEQRRTGHVQRYCSRKCVDEARSATVNRIDQKPAFNTCVVCSSKFQGRRGRKYCSDTCRKLLSADKARQYSISKDAVNRAPRQCPECGKQFSPSYGDKRSTFCSKACCGRYSRRKQKRTHRDYRSRARHHSVAYEPIDPIKVFDRDRWRCQVCGCKTPKRLRGSTKPNAPELDHRVPMVLGGGHTWANVQCCCRQCNSDKGAKTVVGQLPLFENPSNII